VIETYMPLRKLNFEDVKSLLIDPWHVLVVDALGDAMFISTYGQQVFNIVEEVELDIEAHEHLMNLVDENVIWYNTFDVDEIKQRFATPHFFDLWREDAYGEQPDEAYTKATEMGLAGNPRD